VTSSDRTSPLPADRASGSAESEEVFVLPTSLGQDRFWALDSQNPGNPTWSVPVRFRLQGPLNVAFLERAFDEIARRHESLRTVFTALDGQPAQVVKPSLQIQVPVIDLRHLPKPERDAETDLLSFQEARWRFDLATGPLLRVRLLRIEDNEHVMLVTPHHTVIDYWSVGLVSNELVALYDAYARGTEPALPELPIQYGDYAIWQREQTQGPVAQKELAYWKTQLKELPLLDFPTDHPRSSFPTYEGTITSFLLPVKLTDAIRDIANREGATFFNTMLAALSMVLKQYSGQTDFGVATQVAGRVNEETERLIGMFINSVVLRMDLSGDPRFAQLLSRVQDVGLQSIAHQNLRFEQLLKELRPNDYPSHHTLFRLNFICQRDTVKPQEFSGIKLTAIPSKCQGAMYDLNVFLVLRSDGWRLSCEYKTDLYEASTITRLLGDYKTMLELIAENPERHVSEFPLSEGARLAKERKQSGGTPSNPAGGSRALPAATGKVHGTGGPPRTAPAVGSESTVAILPEEASEESYALPASEAQRRFWFLEEIAPGNPALHMRACVRLTGAFDLTRLQASLQALVNRHEILRTTFASTDGDLLQVIAPSRKIALPVTSLEQAVNGNLEAKLREAIRAEASAPLDLVRGPLMRARLFRLTPQEHVFVLTTHHILVDGWSQNVIQRDLWTNYEALGEGREPSLPPLTIQYGDFAHWQQEWLASDNAQIEFDYWKKQLAPPLPVLEIPTDRPPRNRPAREGAMETLLLPEDLIRSLKSLSVSEHVTMFMTMLAGYSAMLHGYTGQDDLVISSPVANRKNETEALVGPFAGPVALRLNLAGKPTVREVLDRIREVTLDALSHTDLPFEVLLEKLKVRSVHGRNPLSQCYFFYQTAFLQPRELRDLTVTPLPDFALGTHFELQMGVVERREGVRAQLEYNPELYDDETIKGILQDYCKILETMVRDPETRIDQLPVSAQQEPAAPAEPSSREFALPQNETERQLAKIWEEVLGVRPIGLDQNYFELGGTSLLAVRMFAEVEKVFHAKLPLSSLFEAQTIQEFAEILSHKDAAPAWSPLVPIQREGSRPPFFCIHGAGGNVLIYRDLSQHLGVDQPFYGLQAQGLDGELPHLVTIEEMAALYVKEIRRIKPHGPYYLGGYCMGGTIALEIAQQLNTLGEETALLALFDTMNWSSVLPVSIWRKTYHVAQRVGFHGMNFFLLDFQGKVKFFKEKLKALRSRSRVWRGMLFGRLGKRGESSDESAVLARIWEANDQAILTYVPCAYPGVITDFRPMVQYARYSSPELKWGQLARGGQEIVSLPVYPAGMLLEPFVKHLADALRVVIDKAIQATSLAP
jgi:non-ribosomal peptide synthetase component F/thioesterase domain-containing protein